ncbi:MAG: DUF481 domain-containing protein [Deltaproteobacteria bacterium]|nr:DUF481 domain-containing protein [Deltaproteobacteria bacterium]
MQNAKLIVAVLFLFAFILDANAEDGTKKGWQRSALFGLNVNQGNSDVTLGSLGLKIEREKSKDIWLFEAEGSQGQTDGETDVQYLKGKAHYKHLLNPMRYFFIGLDGSHDAIADVEYRFILSPALGAFILKDDKFRLSIEAGPAVIAEKLGVNEQEDLAVRVADKFDWQISPTSKFFQNVDIISVIDDPSDYIVDAKLGIEAGITDGLSLVLSLTDRYNNQPADDNKKNDLALISSLRVDMSSAS